MQTSARVEQALQMAIANGKGLGHGSESRSIKGLS